MFLAAAALIVLGVFGGTRLVPARQEALASDLVSAHMRALLPDRLIDVESSDRHTVKPYFQGKLDYAPPVPDLSGSEFSLVGGRVDVVAARRVAALVYKRRQHVINVFVYPETWGTGAPRPGAIGGYSVRAFALGGFWFCSVSDADPSELERLPSLVAEALAPR
jgi:anti-sigma factor RsiW